MIFNQNDNLDNNMDELKMKNESKFTGQNPNPEADLSTGTTLKHNQVKNEE